MSKLGLYLDIRNLLIFLPKTVEFQRKERKEIMGIANTDSILSFPLIPENLCKLMLKIPTSRILAINMTERKKSIWKGE